MTQDEYNELKAQVDAVHTQDVHLGRVLHLMLGHLANVALVHAEPEPVEEEEEEPVQPRPIPRRASRP